MASAKDDHPFEFSEEREALYIANVQARIDAHVKEVTGKFEATQQRIKSCFAEFAQRLRIRFEREVLDHPAFAF